MHTYIQHNIHVNTTMSYKYNSTNWHILYIRIRAPHTYMHADVVHQLNNNRENTVQYSVTNIYVLYSTYVCISYSMHCTKTHELHVTLLYVHALVHYHYNHCKDGNSLP